MRFRRWQTFISLVALCAAAPVVRAQAQPQREPSHVPIGSFENRGDAARLFSQRLQQLQSIRNLEWTDEENEQLRKILDNPQLRNLKNSETLQKLRQDPDIERLIKK